MTDETQKPQKTTTAKGKGGGKSADRPMPKTRTNPGTADADVYQFSAFTSQNAKETMEKIMTQSKTKFEKITCDMGSCSKEQMDALLESGNIFMKGYEDVMKAMVNLAQGTAERHSRAFKTLLGCRTVTELTETQNRLAQESFDDFMGGMTKLSEITVRVATDAFEPLNEQLGKSLRKATESVAA